MVVGYSLGRAYIYSTPEYALAKLPSGILQAAVGAVAGMLICWKCGVAKLYQKHMARLIAKRTIRSRAWYFLYRFFRI